MRKILLGLLQGIVSTAVREGDRETLDRLAKCALTVAVQQQMAKDLR
jgi:hypothetical protein